MAEKITLELDADQVNSLKILVEVRLTEVSGPHYPVLNMPENKAAKDMVVDYWTNLRKELGEEPTY
jgi:hypothetical protein